MVISFDIDNTLIPYSGEFEVEEKTILSNFTGAEPIRKGTVKLFKELKNRGHKIWIYTTSYRSAFNLKKTFISYGLKPSKIINGKTNQEYLKSENCKASKNPNLFGIDLHIDDSAGVEIEGRKYGFKTIIVDPNDKRWAAKILKRIEAIELKLDWQYEQLLITLISLKSNAKRQREIYGYGHTEEEILIDFDNFYTLIQNPLLDHGYINEAENEVLRKIVDFLKVENPDSTESFLDGLETHPAWEIMRGMAKKALIEMGKDAIELEVIHTNKIDEQGDILVQETETRLIEK